MYMLYTGIKCAYSWNAEQALKIGQGSSIIKKFMPNFRSTVCLIHVPWCFDHTVT